MKIVRKRMQPESEKAVDNLFASSLYFSAAALARETEKLAAKCFRPIGLSPSLAAIVVFLLSSTSATVGPSYLAKSLLLSPSTMTRLLKKLEAKGFVHLFEYDGIRMVQLDRAAWEMAYLILDCAAEFHRKCQELLGDDKAWQLAHEMNKATDTLRSGTTPPKIIPPSR
jgi:DNA-binding MarR family transcriptional regulator